MEDLKNMTLLDIMSKWEKTQKIIKSYDEKAGTCLCCNHLFDTLESVCLRYQIKIDEITEKIKKQI
ncbi:MAG: hypothetical protein RBR08_05515 [Desulforegulaceae bacterium]|jgi:hypothetical protein|nr:hypothetical protein [Desulforegulaceae bacterium]